MKTNLLQEQMWLSDLNARLDSWFRHLFCVEDDWRDFFSTDEDSTDA